ncbi:MAG: bifunctional methylenetetrahydrofolate dehydrogenase/methenyltetrahydrofolate cyclohydrolase FolD [Methanomicrobiales archaeon]|nr:bifunctional methylenetetrahydrofolate dehydrogenase/methenyltetrahydrofolate cyclohydrolase FolD [Methanomicrobiales archaeon]MDI6875388.1 bifunctional methylenetetrahydrofolate dehydrogenase/methenyltetrahydrofolate cyclohydrolase FolD [Methanomicrobiales archaeon]
MILDGKAVSERRLDRLSREIEASGIRPRLATIIVGDDPASRLYVRMKHRACERVGIGSIGVELPETAEPADLFASIDRLNRDPDIDGILVQLPLPARIDMEAVLSKVDPEKDVDGFHPCNLGALFAGHPTFAPATPLGIMTLLSEYGISPAGMDAVVIGRSVEVGRPLAALLLSADATVTVCHSRTRDLPAKTREADLLVSAAGRARFVTADMVREGAVVVDVGTNHVNGKLCGDVAFDEVREKVSWITPVPGGVGPMTISSLMENTVRAARSRRCIPVR